MAIVLEFNNNPNNYVVNYLINNNIIYSDSTYLISIVGRITSDDPSGDIINQAYSSAQSDVNWDSYLIDSQVPSFPLFIPNGSYLDIIFNFYPSGIVGTVGKVVFDFGVGIGFYQYNFEEIDPTNSINSNNPQLNFPTTTVGSTSQIDCYINNQTCLSQNYYLSCANPDIAFDSGAVTTSYYSAYFYDRVYWSPTSAYTLSDQIEINADTYPIGIASYVDLTGDSINSTGVYSKKTIISNSISI